MTAHEAMDFLRSKIVPFNWDDTSRALQITNDDRKSLDAYIRFHQSEPCWDEKSSTRWMKKSEKEWETDNLHYFSSSI